MDEEKPRSSHEPFDDGEKSTLGGGGSDRRDSFLSRRDDQSVLARMGKKQVLKRRFGFLSIFSFSCTVLDTWEGFLGTFSTGFLNGGTIGLMCQFLLVWIGILSTFVCIGELASMAPTSGGQYHWVAMLSPKRARNVLSYLTGWMTCLAWIAGIATGSYLTASILSALIRTNIPSYNDTTYAAWQVTLMLWGVVLLCVFLNTTVGNLLPQTEGIFLVIHVLGFFGVLIPLVYYAPKKTASEVFADPTGRLNGGDWPTYGLSFMVGTLGSAFSFVGADAAVHMSEEISDASINVPRSIVGSVVLNGALGFGMLMAIIFCMGDPEAALDAQNEYGYPFIEIFRSATNSPAGATVMTCIIIVMCLGGTVGFVATSSRMYWSFARDRGVPFSEFFSKVSHKSRIPVPAIIVASVFPCLIALINIGSTAVFFDVTSLSVAGFYSTYFIPCALLLNHRCRGTIQHALPGTTPSPAYKNDKTDEYVLTWGRWHVPGILGTVNNAFACCFLITIWFFGFWPSTTPTNAANMNYSSLIFGAVVLFSIVYWVVVARKQYKGPIVEIIG